MKRRRGRRRPKGQRKGHQPSIYIRSFGAIQPGDKVILWCRVSGGPQGTNGNNADQEVEMRAAVEARGANVTSVEHYIGRASGDAWHAWLCRVANKAEREGAVLLAESTSRFVRHPEYHPKHNPHLAPGLQELSDLRWVCGDVTLVTLHDPDITWKDERALQSKRGQRQKGNRGGRPTKRTPGYKKHRRRMMLSKVFWLSKVRFSVRGIAVMLNQHPTQIQRWLNELRGR